MAPVRRKEELVSKDDGDEWLDGPASELAELLGRGSASKILEQPGVGGLREFKQEKKDQKQPGKEEGWDEEDFVFGASQPRVASMCAGRPSRRQSVSRASAENSSELKLQPSSTPPPPVSRRSFQGSRAGGDWDIWKDEDWMDSKPLPSAKAGRRAGYPSPAAARQPSPASWLLAPEEAVVKREAQEEEEDWLSALLSRAKAKAKAQEGNAKPSEAPGEGLEPRSAVREQEMQGPAPLAQVTAPRAPLQAAPQLQAESPALGLLHERRLGAPAAQLGEDASGCRALLLSTQARVAELESQVRILELERTQQKQLLESLQKRHQADLDLLESSHRQREEWLRQDKEQLVARLLSQSRDAEQAWAELLAHYQQRLATLEQQNALELERLRELHRASIQEMRKNHEDELRLLKQLKARELEAVTSTFSATRSLNGITEQVEKLFGDLRELLHKVEATRYTTSEELATGARQRDQQLQMLQDRLSQHQRDMEEERSQHQEVMAKLEARLDEQAQLLEQERWRAAAEQSKVESLQRSLEEQRRMMTQQLSMERAELERAKEQAELEAQEEQLRRDRELLDKAWQELRLEKEKVNGAMLCVRQQEEEVKSMSKLWSQQYEEGERALREACREVSEQQTSLQVMQQHLERRKQQEQHLHQEHLSMAHRRRQLQQLRQELRNNPTMLLTADQDLSAPTRGLSSTLCSPPPVRVHPRHSPVGRTETLATAGSAGLHAALVLLKHWAQQDHDFLEEQQFFPGEPEEAPYNTSSWSG
ncbi:fas-binding factor 1 homolog [Pterocles gutturalis]